MISVARNASLVILYNYVIHIKTTLNICIIKTVCSSRMVRYTIVHMHLKLIRSIDHKRL